MIPYAVEPFFIHPLVGMTSNLTNRTLAENEKRGHVSLLGQRGYDLPDIVF